MPTYKYRREDGTTFEIRQRITADALTECPETGQSVERVITGGSGFHLKGGGWYADGYTSSNGASDKEKGDATGEAKKDAKSEDKKSGSKEASTSKSESGGEKKASTKDAA